MSEIYNWKRYWYLAGYNLKLPFEGFLPDPEDEYQKLFTNEIKTLDELSTYHCMFLLGEPGIGKSTEFIKQTELSDDNNSSTSIIKISVDLKSYDLKNMPISDIFTSDKFIDWLSSSKTLYFYIDSIDECMIQTDNYTVPISIAHELSKYKHKVDKLYIRIFCRTNFWVTSYENEFKRIFSNPDDISTFILAPLRKKDVITVLNKMNIEESTFFQKANELEAIPFLIKPLTLILITDNYKRTSEFPKSKYELYEKGCQSLCCEDNFERSKGKSLSPEQRLIVASRIAALTLFTNRLIIILKESNFNLAENEINSYEFIGGKEEINNQSFNIDKKSIDETLDSGLFSSLGQEKMIWAHKSYSEFLAAWYLIKKEVKTPQILNLITNSNEEGVKVIPQIKETAGWLASMNDEIFTEILKYSPETIVKSDTPSLGDNQKKELVNILLRYLDEGKILESSLSDINNIKNLYYKDIEREIEPYLSDQSMSRSSRELAITFIEIFNIHSFKDDLFNLIKNPDEDYNVRIHATHSLLKIVDEDFKKVLFKISSDHDFLDPSDKIKAIVLNSSWPVCITTEELFKVITPPKEVNIIGSYHMFLSQYLPEKLQATDLIYALNWVDHQFPRRHSADAYSWLISSIITKTIENLQESYVLKSFAKLFIKMSDSHYWGYDNRTTFILRNTLLSNIELKKELVSEIVNHLNDIDTRSEVLFYLVWDILVDKDLEWLIQCLKDEKDINRRVRWSNIIWEKFRFADIPKWIGLLYKNRELDKDLKGKIDDYVKPVSIDSKEPIREKELYYKINASLNIKKDRNDAQSFKEELSLYLEKADYQDPNIWFDIHNLIINYREYSVFDIIKSQGWKLIETKQKSKIMALANNFIKYYSPKKQEPTNDLKFIAQINAIRLVYIQDLNDFDDLIKNNINEWSFIVLIDSFINDAVFYKEIVNHLYIKYQPMILGLISEVIDIEIEQSSRINVIDKLDTCWDNDIADLASPRFLDCFEC